MTVFKMEAQTVLTKEALEAQEALAFKGLESVQDMKNQRYSSTKQ